MKNKLISLHKSVAKNFHKNLVIFQTLIMNIQMLINIHHSKSSIYELSLMFFDLDILKKKNIYGLKFICFIFIYIIVIIYF